jgi:type VII secretion integral membrane protein EccD
VLLAAGAVALTVAGPPWRAPFVGAAVAAVLLLGTSGLVSRAAGDAVFGAVLGCGAGVYGALAGALGLARDGGAAGHGAFTAPGVLAGASVGLLVVLLAGVSVGAGAHVFLAAVAVAVAGVAAGLVAPHTPSPSGGGAAAALVVVFLLVPLVPLIAYRAARLPRPFLPTSARELREGGSLTPGEELSERTLTADRFVTALTAACALVTAATATPLVRAPGWGGPPLVAAGCVLALLRTRLFTGLAQRLWLLAGSLVALGQLMVGLAGRHPGGVATAVAAGGAVLATAVLAGAGGAAGKPSPAAARLLGVAEVLAAIAVVPLALEVLGVYARLRSLTG